MVKTRGQILLTNGRVLIGGRLTKKDVLICDWGISSVKDRIPSISCDEIDCSGRIILPGMIDAHTHIRDPGFTQKEDFHTGTKAAAAGGVTTVLDMPNNKPPTLTLDDLNYKRRMASEKSVVNFGFHFGASPHNLSEIKKVKGVASTKVFMNHSTGDMRIDDPKLLEGVFRNSRMVMAHAEGDKVRQAVELARKTGKRLHLAHITRSDEIRWLRKNKIGNVSCEATPHHLLLDEDNSELFKVKPPLNTKGDKVALWKAVNSGLIDTIGSDHAPHLLKEKKTATTYGLPGVETTLPLMLNAVNEGKLTLGRLAKLCCENPARVFGIKNKGVIQKGYDADLVIVDMEEEKMVSRLYTKCRWSPYKNRLLKGWPETTIVGGNIVYDKGRFNTKTRGREVTYKRRWA
ncbi:MAG: amidohydrolase family protein [Candidatus Altiarchaeota archaeon]